MSAQLPREVWVATLTQAGITGSTCDAVIRSAVAKMERFLTPFRPDIICLPEAFHTVGVESGRLPASAGAEVPPGPFTAPLAEFARAHSCYIIAPIYTREGEHLYNAAVVIDRRGEVIGEYRKIHPTEGELEEGIAPGPADPPVLRTDFGTIGIQICFDINWPDAWRRLADKGAEILFWPSAFAGGCQVGAMAWRNHFHVVSSTRKGTSRICDITGEEIARSEHWNSWGACAPVNLEKAFLHTWPYVQRFPEVQAKYGRKVRIRNLAEEEFTLIESLSPDLKIADLMEEFDFKTHREHRQSAEKAQKAFREKHALD